jgi:hypothetical protein
MKSNLAIMTLKAVLALSAVTTFVACSSNAQTRSPAGTQDVGGGNGVTEGKIYEAYIVDVTTLKAFQKYVKPAFEKLDAPVKEGDETENGFYQVARMKTWYIAPVSLKPLSKEAIGFSASESKNVQFAVQTKDKVVIDKTLFDKMTIEEQGRLIMHEMVMSLFLVKYMSIPEIQASACRGGYCTQESQDNTEKWKEYFEAAFKPLPYKPLSNSDYEHIRAVTAWFFSHAAKPEVTRAQVFKVLIAHDFDKRFFSKSEPYDDKGEKKVIEVENSQELMMKATRRAQALGTMPDRCYGLRTKISFPCKLTMQKGEDHIYTTPFLYTLPGFEITLSSEKVNRKIHGYYGSKSSNEVSSNSLTEFVLYEQHLPETCLVGERVDDVVALLSTRENIMEPEFNANNAQWDYEAFIFQPKVITGELDSKENAGEIRVAQDTPRVTSIENDTIVVYSDDAKLEQTSAFATAFMNGMVGKSQCRPKASK